MSLFFQLLFLGAFTLYFFVLDTSKTHLLEGLNNRGSTKSVNGQQVQVGGDKNIAPTGPTQVMKDVLLTEYQSNNEGEKEWVLAAQSALSDTYDKKWEVQKALIHLFQNNRELVEIQAGRGQVDTQTRNLNMHAGVIGKTQSGYTFKTQDLVYNSPDESFITESSIYFEAPDRKTLLKGTAMQGYLAEKIMQVSGPVECQQKIEGYDLALIKSDESVISLDQRKVVFNDNLFIQMDDINITGNKAEFVYSENGKSLDSLIITGKVFVSSGERSAASERLEIRLNEDLFLFQGNPRFVSGGNVLVGNEIVLYDKGRKVLILKGQVKSKASKKVIER